MKKGLLLLMLSVFSFGGYAEELHPVLETDRENTALARIYTLLQRIKPLIAEAKRYQNPHARLQFCYDPLQQDIHHIQLGILQKFHPASIEPRSLQPIQGDYVTFRRKAHE